MKTVVILLVSIAFSINAFSQKLVKTYWDYRKTKIQSEYYIDTYGTKTGAYKGYSEYGGILLQGLYKDDAPVGKWIENYTDGKLHYIKFYSSPGYTNFDVNDGKIISYYEDGKTIKYERNFKNQELDGVCKEYDESGNLIKEGVYINGSFERTGESKRIYDEEQEKQKQATLIKNTEEYKKIIPEADKAYAEKNFKKALQLYKSASDLMGDEKYPKDKISEMIEAFHTNSVFFQEYIKVQFDSLTNDYNKQKADFKIKSIKEYNQYTYKYEDKSPKTVSTGYQTCDCKTPWNEQEYSTVFKCFEINKEFYEPYQIAITNSFFKYKKVLDNEESAVKKSSIDNFEFNSTRNSFYTYDKELFIKNINDVKIDYSKAKSMMTAALKFEQNIKQIEILNNENKKKVLFNKHKVILNDFQAKYNTNQSLDEYNIILNDANLFLERVISLYTVENKELEKNLKSAETNENIKSIILGK